jgi:tripartite-type tricarboxylate transporter receptor subunit TctC
MRKVDVKRLIIFMLTLGVLNAATAQPYPSRPIRFVVPYPGGGATDFVARAVAERLSKEVGQPVIIDNRPGAAGALGATEVARSAPDGYTVLIAITDVVINNGALFKSLGYDPLKDFVGVTQIVRSPALITTSQDTVKSMSDFKSFAGSRVGKLSYASWGLGGIGHLAVESINRELNLDMVHAPQRGEAPVIADLLAKTVDLGITSVATAKPHVESGKLFPLAVVGPQRSNAMPEVPTMSELGFAASIYQSTVWIGVMLPAKTPGAIVGHLASQIRKIVATPEMGRAFAERGMDVMNTTPEQFQTALPVEFHTITTRIRELGIEAK